MSLALRAVLIAGLLLTGCASPPPPPPQAPAMEQVTGTVTYRERIALPPTAVVRVQLADVSRMDAMADVVDEQVIRADGRQVPISFELSYDPAKIVAAHSYAVLARIEVDGQLRFISDRRYSVITQGAPNHAELVLRAVASRP